MEARYAPIIRYRLATHPISHSPTQRGQGLIPLTEKQGQEEPHLSVKPGEEKTRLDFSEELDSCRLFKNYRALADVTKTSIPR